jgi:hypothetical protein
MGASEKPAREAGDKTESTTSSETTLQKDAPAEQKMSVMQAFMVSVEAVLVASKWETALTVENCSAFSSMGNPSTTCSRLSASSRLWGLEQL